LQNQLRNDDRIYHHLRQFSAVVGQSVSWTLTAADRVYVCECRLGELTGLGKSIKKKTVNPAKTGALPQHHEPGQADRAGRRHAQQVAVLPAE
jgi:hypothetical protein